MQDVSRKDGVDREAERIARTQEMLPDDACTCLEIGFKDQRISRVLARYDLTGIDLPGPPPASRENKLAFATIAALPFRDRAFDLTVCTEVLEHLDPPTLADGVAELARVSGRYILVSVPDRQRVWNELAKCASCGFVSNQMGHLYRFDEERVASLFGGFTPIRYAKAGDDTAYAPDFLYRVRNRFGNDWLPHPWGCFACGAGTTRIEPNLIGRVARSIAWRWEKRLPRRNAFLFALLERTGPSVPRPVRLVDETGCERYR